LVELGEETGDLREEVDERSGIEVDEKREKGDTPRSLALPPDKWKIGGTYRIVGGS
jgi:hypothetical protein